MLFKFSLVTDVIWFVPEVVFWASSRVYVQWYMYCRSTSRKDPFYMQTCLYMYRKYTWTFYHLSVEGVGLCALLVSQRHSGRNVAFLYGRPNSQFSAYSSLSYFQFKAPFNVRRAKLLLNEKTRGILYFSRLVYVLNFRKYIFICFECITLINKLFSK